VSPGSGAEIIADHQRITGVISVRKNVINYFLNGIEENTYLHSIFKMGLIAQKRGLGFRP